MVKSKIIINIIIKNSNIFKFQKYYIKSNFTLTLDVLNSSLIPTGNTFYLSQSTLGHTPNLPNKYFSLMIANPAN